MVTSRTSTDPLDRNTTQPALNVLNIRASIGRQVLVLLDTHGVTLPAGEGNILDLDLLQDFRIGRHRVLRAGAVGQNVSDTDLDLVKVIEHVQLGQVKGRVVVDSLGVAAQDHVEPTATTSAAGGDTELLTHALQLVASVVQLLTGERTRADTGSVGLNDTDDGADAGGVEGEGLDGTAQTGGRGGHEGVSAVVQVQHESVGALDEGVGGVLVLLKEGQLVDDVRAQAFTVFLVLLDAPGKVLPRPTIHGEEGEVILP